jgi:hypothetical protein
MNIRRISDTSRLKIINKSVNPLPTNPGRAGFKADEVKKAMFGFVTDPKDSVIEEINRIVDEANSYIIEVITESVTENLINYYTKSQTYSQDEINNLVSSIPKFNIKVVSNLPSESISSTTVYLVKSDNSTENLYTEYIYVDETWEMLGSQKVDLSDYYTRTEIDNLLKNVKVDLTSYYTREEIDDIIAEIKQDSGGTEIIWEDWE